MNNRIELPKEIRERNCELLGDIHIKPTANTPRSMARYNTIMQVKKLTRFINCFTAQDIFLTLHYCKSDKPQKAKALLSMFIRELRRMYRRKGKQLKYIKIPLCEKDGSKRHYVIINNIGVSLKDIKPLWDYNIAFSSLSELSNSEKLSQFLLKSAHQNESAYNKCYIVSRNITARR